MPKNAGSELTWRLARSEDTPALVALIRSAYRGQASQAGWTSEAHLVEGDRTDVDSLLAVIAAARSEMLVGEHSGAVIACCQLEDRGDGVAYLGTFAVAPQRQSGGIGRRLLERAQDMAARRYGAHTIEITVLAQQADLLAWYERRGFARTGETRPFPADRRFARPLRDSLRFEVLTKPITRAARRE